MSRKAFFCFILTVTIISLSGERKIQAAGTVIYVSASGNDATPGTKNQPMASMNGAVNKMRKLKKYSGTTVEIRIGDGEYFMQEPLVFEPQDSGTNGAPLIIKAEEDFNGMNWEEIHRTKPLSRARAGSGRQRSAGRGRSAC